MALVSYDYDSDSENEFEKEDNQDSSKPQEYSEGEKFDKDTKNNLFSNLPVRKKIVKDLVEDQIEDFIPKSKPICKTKQKVKITIPSLSDFNDIDDEPQTKKQKQPIKGSGLMSLLPPVKGSVTTTKSFVPNVVYQKKNPKSITKSNALVPDAVKKIKASEKSQQTHEDNAESDDDIETPETFDDEMWKQIFSRPKVKPVVRDIERPGEEAMNIAPEPEKPYDGLDNQAFKELIGRNKRPIGNIKLIDINEEEILPEKDIWMAKSLTDPEMAPKQTVEDTVDPTRRKKHHITYLAQQAKANEQELQNAWAASKNNRMASRAKYGF